MEKGHFFDEVEITREIVWKKRIKKDNFKKRSNEFNRDKSPD